MHPGVRKTILFVFYLYGGVPHIFSFANVPRDSRDVCRCAVCYAFEDNKKSIVQLEM